ncbi:MAG: ABC transporter transmembrane domain-containing protein, partial [Cyclobacteriaceae bacterium]|nr:ABC transporter transmembrane domain-containing protein [Cyclobacteriaceae bacterium]
MENKEKIKISREGIKKLLGVFKFILPYKGLFILGLILLFLSTFLVLSFPIISGKLLDVASGEKWVISTGDLLQGISKKQQEGGYVIENVTQIAFLLMGILVIQSIVSFLRVYVFARVTERSIADMRKELFSKYMQLPMKYFDNNRVGDILSRITSDISLLQETLSVTSAELFRQFSVLLVGLGFIFYVLPDLSLFML